MPAANCILFPINQKRIAFSSAVSLGMIGEDVTKVKARRSLYLLFNMHTLHLFVSPHVYAVVLRFFAN
jgi:hypothetical protein